jgi:hypothetical protein
VVIAGAIHHDLDQQHVAKLRAISSVTDAMLYRSTRLRALEAMDAHNIVDYRAMLEGAD